MTDDQPTEHADDADPEIDDLAAEDALPEDEDEDDVVEDDDGVDEDLWGADDTERAPINRNVIVGIVAVVALVIIGVIVFGGGGSDGDDKTTTKTEGAAKGPDGEVLPTSAVAPYNAKNITPTTLPPGAQHRGCGTWDSAFNYPPKEIKDGVYIWSDFKGWHIRVAGTKAGTVSGSVTGQETPNIAGTPTAGASATADDVAKRVVFTIEPGAEPQGFDFSAGCNQKELTFELNSGDTALPVELIALGSRGIVKEYPLVARRTLPPPE